MGVTSYGTPLTCLNDFVCNQSVIPLHTPGSNINFIEGICKGRKLLSVSALENHKKITFRDDVINICNQYCLKGRNC